MTPKKPRKNMDDSALAESFVYGNPEPTSKNAEPQIPPVVLNPTQSQEPILPPNRSRVMDKLLSAPVQKEPTIRFTVDMTETMHRKLSILAARTGKKKAEIVRMLLDEALQELNE